MTNEIFGSNDEREKALLDKIEDLLDSRWDLILDLFTDHLEEINLKLEMIIRQGPLPELADVKPYKLETLRICLTPGERLALDATVHGRTDEEIAGNIDSSEDEVKNTIYGLLKKLSAADRTQLAISALIHNMKYEEMPLDGKMPDDND